MVEQLNPQQQQAVHTPQKYTLVLAGAGSGKTKVLTSRMAWLLQTGQALPTQLLAVTFTNKAAKEMLHRLSSLMPLNPRYMWIGTFHGLCNRMLRAHYRDVGLPQGFQILDSADQLAAIKRLIKAQQLDPKFIVPTEVRSYINKKKGQGLRAQDIENTSDPKLARFKELYALYDEQCEREGVVDFAELLLRCYELLLHNQPVREHYQRRFKYILIDEFQDTNALQYNWLKLLAGDQASLFAVGDDDQSIYAFRGANVGNMRDFEQHYAKDNVIKLEQNYRSYGHILQSANQLIQHNTLRLGKSLWTDRGHGEPVRIMILDNEADEAQWVRDEIKSLINEQGYAYRDIAILYRSNVQSRALEHALVTSAIPYKVYGGTRFYERQEIKHVLAYLRLVANLNDDTSFSRVVNFPPRGIGPRTLEQLNDVAQTIGTSLALAVGGLQGKSSANLSRFIQSIQAMQEVARHVSLPELVDHVIEISGLKDYYQQQRDGEEKLENMLELISAAKVFGYEENFEGCCASERVKNGVPDPDNPFAQEETTALEQFLTHASLEAGDNQAKSGDDAVQLMTVHAAKGLEFNAVFITGVEEGLFPHEMSLHEHAGLEEERRLMYVAITRAKERLYITMARTRMLYGQTRYALPSRFIEELPEGDLKWLCPKDMIEAFAPPSSWGTPRPVTTPISSGVQVGDKHFKIGQTVSHPRFGQGVIMQLSGQGEHATARVFFTLEGEKTLALNIAKLEIL